MGYAENTKHVRFYYLSGLVENKLKLLITKEREKEIKNFQKLFSSHIYAIATDDFEFENYVRSVVPGCHGVRETTGNSGYGKAKKPSVSTTQVKDTSQDIFKKKEAPKKGVAKAFSKIEPKSSSVKKEAVEKPTVKKEVQKPKSNQKVNSFFGKKTESKSKKETKKIEIEEKIEDEEMEVDQKEAEDESDDEPVTKKRKSPRKKTKHRRIQMESSSDEDENEGDKLLFGDSQEERLKNISLDDDKVLAEDTIRSDSEHEGLPSDEMSEEEKENKQKKDKKEKTQFGSAKVIGGDQVPTKKVKKKRYTVDDEGNMVTETYFVKEEMTSEEIEKQKKEDEKRKSPAAKSD